MVAKQVLHHAVDTDEDETTTAVVRALVRQ